MQTLAAISRFDETPGELTRRLRDAMVQYGSETPDNLECCARLQLGEVDGAVGIMVSDSKTMLQDLAWSLEELPLPGLIGQVHPNLTEGEWSSFTRLVTLIFTALARDSDGAK